MVGMVVALGLVGLGSGFIDLGLAGLGEAAIIFCFLAGLWDALGPVGCLIFFGFVKNLLLGALEVSKILALGYRA